MPKIAKAKKVFPIKTAALAKIFDVSARTIRNWVNAGMPQSSFGIFDLASILSWYIAKTKDTKDLAPSADMVESQKIYWEAKAIRETLKAQKEKFKVVTFLDIETDCYNAGKQVKEGLKSLIEQTAPELAAEDDLFEIKKILKEKVTQILEELYSDFNNLQEKHKEGK